MSKRLQFVCLTILVILAGATGCRRKEIGLPFETIERRAYSDTGELWEARESGLMVIATPEDLAQIDNLFTQDAQARLGEVDLSSYFVVAIFLGWQSVIHEGITLERVIREADVVSFYARAGRETEKQMLSSPYHLVKVRKEGNWDREIDFQLFLDGTSATSVSFFIP